jgi:hypothetical protein
VRGKEVGGRLVSLGNGMSLLPAAPGACPLCAVVHDPSWPHNAQSLFYLMRFKGVYGRDATWADAVAHCDPELAAEWEQELRRRGGWTAPVPPAFAISEPLPESEGTHE